MNSRRAWSSCSTATLEGGGELAELVSAGVHDRLAEISTRDPISRAFQPADAPGEDGRRQVADEE